MSDARVGEGMAPPVITVVQRGQITEVAHRGDVAVVADGGRLAASVGEPDRLISLRSSVKPFTAVAVLAAADEAGLTLDDEMIALASASHAGADEHTAVAQRMVEARHFKSRVDLMVHEKQRQEILKDIGADSYVD